MASWERFNETTLPNKKAFYRKLYLENITDEDYIHSQKVPEEAHSLPASGLAWQACLKKAEVKLELLADNMLIMVEKGIRGGICHAIHRYAKTNNKYMKNYNKNIELSYSCIKMQKICMDEQCFKNYLEMVLNGKKMYLNLMKSS